MARVPRELVERLYAAPPEGFVAARDEAVAAAREAGDRETAREIAKLRKPTVAAWLVNLLALRRPELIAELVELAAALRAAQRELRGDELRELSAQRRAAVSALVDEARTLAHAVDPATAGQKLPLAEVEATLNAALANEEVAEQVRSGRLVRPATYAGFGEVPRPRLRLVTGGAVEEPTPPRRGRERPARPAEPTKRAGAAERRAAAAEAAQAARAEEAARRARRRALDAEFSTARAEQRRAETELERAEKAEREGAAELAEIEARLAELERRRSAVETELSRRKLARRTAERQASAARRRVGEVQAAVEAFEAELENVKNRGRKAQS